MSTSALALHAATGHHGAATHRGVVMILSCAPMTHDAVAPVERAIRAAARTDGAAVLVVIEPVDGRVRPEPESREAATEILRRCKDLIRALALVIRAEGFPAAVMRGVLTSVTMIARPAGATRVFDDVAEATRWLATELPGPAGAARPSAAELLEGFESLRAQVHALR